MALAKVVLPDGTSLEDAIARLNLQFSELCLGFAGIPGENALFVEDTLFGNGRLLEAPLSLTFQQEMLCIIPNLTFE